MKVLVRGGSLREDATNSNIQSIHLHHEFDVQIRHLKDQNRGEPHLELPDGALSRWWQVEVGLGACDGAEQSRNGTVAVDKSPIEIGKPQEVLELLMGVGGWPSGVKLGYFSYPGSTYL